MCGKYDVTSPRRVRKHRTIRFTARQMFTPHCGHLGIDALWSSPILPRGDEMTRATPHTVS